MSNLIGKTLGKVRVEMFIAKGGMAEVYIGTHTSLHRSVAIKLLKADLQGEVELRERFEREARAIAMLRHPNIIQVFDFDSHEDQPYLVMEYVPGVSLGAYLRSLHKNTQRLPLPQVLSLLKKIANALSYAHDNNVVHRDVKPANILLTSPSMPVSEGTPLPADVEPILTDFGLVRFTKSTMQTSTGVITGTPAYMSPEQARGEQVDARTDVYSLGVTVYEMLSGNVPFDADSALGVLHQVVHDPHPPIEGISERIQDVINRALSKDPEERFQTTLKFAEAFEEAVTQSANAETATFPSVLSRSATRTRKNYDKTVTASKERKYMPIIIGMVGIAIFFGAFSLAQISKKQSITLTDVPITDQTANSEGPIAAPVTAETFGLLRFQDGSKHADHVTFSSNNLPLPPEGKQYEAWLVEDDGETRYSIGIVEFDSNNHASLSYVDDEGHNLLTLYHGVELTIEPVGDNNPNPSNDVAYLTMLPSSGFGHVRHLLSSFSGTPNQTPFIYGLRTDSELLNALSTSMLTAFEASDEKSVQLQAEQMINIIVGAQSDQHKDWNKDGNIDDPSDGFGMLFNGSNSGYIQGVYSHANLSLTTPDATENMQVHGEHVKIAATNVSEWTPLLRDQLIAVIEAPTLQDAEVAIRQSITLVDQIYNGVDVNGNENIEAIPGEGGVVTAYNHAYYMADIDLMP